MEQLILHAIGDYWTQSGWMATNKTERSWPALVHATIYALPFLLIASGPAWLVIWSTHFLIDRFRLARFIVFAKEFMAPVSQWPTWADSRETGYPSVVPGWLSKWLMIIADNTLHLALNWLALRYL